VVKEFKTLGGIEMLYASFNWDCPKCTKVNWEDEADDERRYTCSGCKNKFYLTFDVHVAEVELCDEAKEAADYAATFLVAVDVSSDKGETWVEMTINTRDLNPDTSPVKPGDWIKRNNLVYEVTITPRNLLTTKQLQTVVGK
jgi:hypothetical protein